MSLCEVRCCCTAAVGVSVYCAGALKFRKRVQDGTRNMRAHREAPFVAVTKGRPGSAAAVAATTYKWLGARLDTQIHSSRRQHSTKKWYKLHRSMLCYYIVVRVIVVPAACCRILGSTAHTHTLTYAEALFTAATNGKALKHGCCCAVAASRYAHFEGWCGTCSRYWYIAAERKPKMPC